MKLCVEKKVTPYIARRRTKHHYRLEDLLRRPQIAEARDDLPPADEEQDRVRAMEYRMQTMGARALYAHRNTTIEPVFGIAKRVPGFRGFMLRGLKKAEGD